MLSLCSRMFARFPRVQYRVGAVLAAALLATTTFAQPPTISFQRVIGSGDPAPGFNNGSGTPLNTSILGRAFQANGAGVLSMPCINVHGEVVFRALSERIDTDTVISNGTKGLYSWSGGSPTRLVAEQYTNSVGNPFTNILYPVPGQPAGTKFSDFSPPLLNDQGYVVFRASWSGPNGGGSGFYALNIHNPPPVGPIVKIVDTSDPVPGYAGTLFSSGGFGSGTINSNNMLISLNNVGQVVFVGLFQRNPPNGPFEVGIYGSTVAGGTPVRLADSTSDLTIIPNGEISPFMEINSNASPALNDVGDVLFIGAVNSFRGLFTVPVNPASGVVPTRLVRQNRTAPTLHDGSNLSYFSLFGDYDLNDAGQYVFQHSFASGAGAVNGVFKGVLPLPPNSPNGLVADSVPAGLGGIQVPGRALTADFADLTGAVLNDTGDLALQSRDNGVSNGQGVYAGDLAAAFTNLAPFNKVAQTPDTPPQAGGSASFLGFDGRGATINEAGNMALAPSTTTGVSGEPLFGLYFYESCSNQLHRVVDRNTSASSLGGKTFAAAGCGGDPCERDLLIWNGFQTRAGYYRSMNDSNDIAFLVAFSTFDVAIYVAHVNAGGGGQLAITCPPPATIECAADLRTVPSGTPTVTGCGNIQVTSMDGPLVPAAPGSCPTVGTFIRTWTATSGTQSVSCDQTVTVRDTTPPVVTAPPDVLNLLCGACIDPSVQGVATAVDGCSGAVPAAQITHEDDELFELCQLGVIYTRTWTATDACGNSASDVQIIHIDTSDDVTPPSITCPADLIVPTQEGSCSASQLNLGVPIALDECTKTRVENNAPTVFPLGTTPVLWTATDGCGNFETCTQLVTVTNSGEPLVSCNVDTMMLWPPNHNLVNVDLEIVLNEECDSGIPPTVTVYANEDDEEATGDGTHSPDTKDLAAGMLRLRAERRGDGIGRVYLVVVTAVDVSGVEGRSVCAVVVPHGRNAASLDAVAAEAADAQAYFQATSAVPPGYVEVGDGAVIGPKQ